MKINIWKIKNNAGSHDCFLWREMSEQKEGYCMDCGRKIPLYKLRLWLIRFNRKYL